MSKFLYIDLNTGELLTWEQAMKTAREQYDFGDPTNIFTFEDHFVRVEDYQKKMKSFMSHLMSL